MTTRSSLGRFAAVLAAVALASLALLGSGCGTPTPTPSATPTPAPTTEPAAPLPTDTPGITGAITYLAAGTGGAASLGSITVEGGEQPEGAVSDKAVVNVTKETAIFDADGKPSTPDKLQVGTEVKVWFTGRLPRATPSKARRPRSKSQESPPSRSRDRARVARGCLGGERQADRELRARTGPAVHADRALVPLDDLLGDGEPDAQPAGRTRARRVGPPEPAEDVGQVLLGDAYPGVAHLDERASGIDTHRTLMLPPEGCSAPRSPSRLPTACCKRSASPITKTPGATST